MNPAIKDRLPEWRKQQAEKEIKVCGKRVENELALYRAVVISLLKNAGIIAVVCFIVSGNCGLIFPDSSYFPLIILLTLAGFFWASKGLFDGIEGQYLRIIIRIVVAILETTAFCFFLLYFLGYFVSYCLGIVI